MPRHRRYIPDEWTREDWQRELFSLLEGRERFRVRKQEEIVLGGRERKNPHSRSYVFSAPVPDNQRQSFFAKRYVRGEPSGSGHMIAADPNKLRGVEAGHLIALHKYGDSKFTPEFLASTEGNPLTVTSFAKGKDFKARCKNPSSRDKAVQTLLFQAARNIGTHTAILNHLRFEMSSRHHPDHRRYLLDEYNIVLADRMVCFLPKRDRERKKYDQKARVMPAIEELRDILENVALGEYFVHGEMNIFHVFQGPGRRSRLPSQDTRYTIIDWENAHSDCPTLDLSGVLYNLHWGKSDRGTTLEADLYLSDSERLTSCTDYFFASIDAWAAKDDDKLRYLRDNVSLKDRPFQYDFTDRTRNRTLKDESAQASMYLSTLVQAAVKHLMMAPRGNKTLSSAPLERIIGSGESDTKRLDQSGQGDKYKAAFGLIRSLGQEVDYLE